MVPYSAVIAHPIIVYLFIQTRFDALNLIFGNSDYQIASNGAIHTYCILFLEVPHACLMQKVVAYETAYRTDISCISRKLIIQRLIISDVYDR